MRIRVDLELNWVFSNQKKHDCPKRQEIVRYLDKMKESGFLNSYKFTMEPLQKNMNGKIFKNKDKITDKLLIKSVPLKTQGKFDNCKPSIVAMRDNDKRIRCNFCMNLGKESSFGELGSDAKDDLMTFLNKHIVIKKNFKRGSGVFNTLKEIDSGEDFKKLLNSPCSCCKNDNVCSICRYLFDKKLI